MARWARFCHNGSRHFVYGVITLAGWARDTYPIGPASTVEPIPSFVALFGSGRWQMGSFYWPEKNFGNIPF